MTITISLQEMVEKQQEQTRQFRQALRDKIQSLPANPRVTQLSDNPRCFVVKFSDLNNNWSPHHHDFRWQYEQIIKKLDVADISNIESLVDDLLITHKIKVNSSWYSTLHPDVLQSLGELFYGPGACYGKNICPLGPVDKV